MPDQVERFKPGFSGCLNFTAGVAALLVALLLHPPEPLQGFLLFGSGGCFGIGVVLVLALTLADQANG